MRPIDADALFAEFENADWYNNADRDEIAEQLILQSPTIEAVSVVRGEWIRDRYWSRGVGMGEEYGFFYKCSLCEYEVESGYTRCGFNYCPNCGAKMDGEREGE